MWKMRPTADCQLSIGTQSIVEAKVAFERIGARLEIGSRSFIGAGTITIADCVVIGDDVMVAWGATISDHNSHSVKFSERSKDVVLWFMGEKDWSSVLRAKVTICDKVWIGFGAIILKGITIGEGAVVAAGSVVTKDVHPWTIVAGNPARTIREIAENER